MLARLILVLMLFAFAAPAGAAMPACHDGGGRATAAMPHGMPAAPAPAPDKAKPAHVCVGCVPVGDWLAARVAAPLPPVAQAPELRETRLDLGRGIAPALPPPRAA